MMQPILNERTGVVETENGECKNNNNSKCRICLSHSMYLTSIFSPHIVGEPTIGDMLTRFCAFQLTKDNDFFNQICETCSNETVRAYNFKLKCEKSHEFLLRQAKEINTEMNHEFFTFETINTDYVDPDSETDEVEAEDTKIDLLHTELDIPYPEIETDCAPTESAKTPNIADYTQTDFGERSSMEKDEKDLQNDLYPTNGLDYISDSKSLLLTRMMSRSMRALQDAATSASNNTDITTSDNDDKMKRSKARWKRTGRNWDRKNACFYCQHLVTNFTRHLRRHHPNEEEVIQYLSITDTDPKIKKKKRQVITDKLRNRGNFMYNSKVYIEMKGDLLPNRRNIHGKATNPSNFVICKTCLGTFKRSTFYRHDKKCRKAV